jgi:parallel beta-helix repeat protein
MRRPAVLFPIVLALGAMTLAPWASAQAQDSRQEGPIEIEKCQAIEKSGSYKLVNNLIFKGPAGGSCLSITADFVTIDLAGFTITGPGFIIGPAAVGSTPIAAQPSSGNLQGIAVRNGSISNFTNGVALGADGSIVEGLRVFGGRCPCSVGIDVANGIVRGNIVVGFAGPPSVASVGIIANGILTGNSVSGSRDIGIFAFGQGSTVIGNTATNNFEVGIEVGCPSNVTDNTAVNNGGNLLLGDGCNNTNNVAPDAAPLAVSSLSPAVLSLMAARGFR